MVSRDHNITFLELQASVTDVQSTQDIQTKTQINVNSRIEVRVGEIMWVREEPEGIKM